MNLIDLKTVSFSGHESFPFRYTWLTKGVTHCDQKPDVFNDDNAIAILGVGKNMVRSIRHWCITAKLAEESQKNRSGSLQPTDLGRHIFLGDNAWDPYLEDIGTLWLIHWLIATNKERATTWYFAFNHIHQPEFSRDGLEHTMLDLMKRNSSLRISPGTVKRDIEVFIRTYTVARHSQGKILEETLDCPLVELNLIRPTKDAGNYVFNRGNQDSLDNAIFLYSVIDFAEPRLNNQTTVSFEELSYGDRSPGKVFKIDETSMGERLENIESLTHGSILFTETAGLKQLVFKRPVNKMELLRKYYGKAMREQ